MQKFLHHITLIFISIVLICVMFRTQNVSAFYETQHHSAQIALRGDLAAHDPSLIRQGKTYYVFATGGGLQIRTSTDLQNWTRAGSVFSTIPSWISQDVGSNVTDLWAPDISYVKGTYYLYYAGSAFGKNTSVIGLTTNQTLDPTNPNYHWVDQGLVIRSTPSDDFNAIDPNLTFDANGNPWLDFGSFWSGIQLRRLDSNSLGHLDQQDTKLYHLASNPNGHAIEAPFLIYHKPYYYLFTSIDYCCRGADSTYKIAMARAQSITGPYLNKDGQPMGQNANFTVVATGSSYAHGPGGESIYLDGNIYRIIFHYYAGSQGKTTFAIFNMSWGKDDWPLFSPN